MAVSASRAPSAWGRVIGVSASFNISYLMLAFLVPVYAAVRLHDSLAAIGVLTALPSMLQLPMRTVSGALSDSWGERPLLRLAFAMGALAGVLVAADPRSATFLLLAQAAVGVSRGLFWVPMQSYVTQLPGDKARALGHLSSYNNAGGLCGILAAGPLAAVLGFRFAFGFTAVCQLAAIAFSLGLPQLAAGGRPVGFAAAMAELPRVLARPVIWLCGGLALISAVPQALVQSFYPVYLTHLGEGPAAASAFTSLRSFGMICAGFVAAQCFRRLGRRLSFVVAGLGLAATLALTAQSGHLALVVSSIFLAGAASGLTNTLGLTISAEVASGRDRGAIIAMNNVFFAISMLLVPLLFGQVADRVGLARTFDLLALVIALSAALLALAWKRLYLPRPGAIGATR